MTLAAGFLSGAAGRLLPASLPFRYFGGAVAFHLVAWVAVLVGWRELPAFGGGFGWPLAALHAITLGVLAMTVIGASLQLFPVATRRPVAHVRAAAAVFVVYAPGVALLCAGMAWASPPFLAAGAIAVVASLVAYLVLLGRNLLGASGMPLVVAHGVVAAIALAAALASAAALVAPYSLGLPVDRAALVTVHVVLAAYGFVGMMALGLSYVLVPMFALAEAPDARRGWASFALAVIGLACGVATAARVAQPLVAALAAMCGVASVVVHVQLMRDALRQGLRRELGTGVTLVRVAWGAAVASLALAAALALNAPWPRLGALFVATLVAGWLLTFVLGVLQRIVPFLASLHAVRGRGRPPTPSSLVDERVLRLHLHAHVAALVLLAVAIAADSAPAALAAGVAGVFASAAYAWFFVVAMRRAGLPHPVAPRTPEVMP